MKKLIPIVLFALFAGSVVDAVPFQQIIGEDVDCFVSIRNLTELRERLEEHPIIELFSDDSFQEWFDGLNGAEESEEETQSFFEELEDEFGLSKDAFFELFPGQVGLALYNLSDQLPEEDKEMDFVIMAEFSEDAERLDELMQMQFERNAKMHKEVNPESEHELIEETFLGETLYFDETFDGETTYIEDGFALVDGIFLLATTKSRLRAVVETIKEGAEVSLSDSEPYQQSRDYSGRGDVTFYLNLVELIPPLNAQLEALPFFNNLTLFGVTPQSLDSALSLESLQGVFLDFDIVEDGILSHYGLVYSDKTGLLSIIENVDGELPEARYVPDNILNSSIGLFDLSAMYNSLEKILGTASPHILTMIDIQLQNIQSNTGVDLRSTILENFGIEMVTFSILREDRVSDTSEILQAQQVFVIELKNSEAFSQAVNAMVDLVPGMRASIEETPFEGETIYSIVAPGNPTKPDTEISYTFTRSKLILTIGHVSILHNVLVEIGKESDGFWQNPDIEVLFERIERPGATSRAYYDVGEMIKAFSKVLAATNRNIGEAPQSLQKAFNLVVEGNEVPRALFWRMLIVKSEDE